MPPPIQQWMMMKWEQRPQFQHCTQILPLKFFFRLFILIIIMNIKNGIRHICTNEKKNINSRIWQKTLYISVIENFYPVITLLLSSSYTCARSSNRYVEQFIEIYFNKKLIYTNCLVFAKQLVSCSLHLFGTRSYTIEWRDKK